MRAFTIANRMPLRLAVILAMLWAVLMIGLFPGASPGLAASLLAAQDKPDKATIALSRILNDLSGQRAEVIAIQRELVSRPALNPEDGGEGEDAKARWIEDWLVKKGLPHALRIDAPDERVPAKVRPNLIIRYPGASERTLWLVGHLDTSPPGALNLWTGSPWALRTEGDTVYGRGVEDNHQAITSGLVLLDSLARNRVAPPLSFGLVLTSCEKHHYLRKYGIDAVLQARPELFKPGDLIVVNDYGNAKGSIVEVAEKGSLWLRITVTGRQSHAALTHQGINALDAGANLIVDLRTLHGRFPREDALFTPPVSTFAVTKPESLTASVNQIPGEFIFHLDCRLLPPYTPELVMTAVRELADAAEKRDAVRIQIEQVQSIPAVPGTAPDAPVVKALRRAVRAQLGVESFPMGMGGVTLAAELRARGLPVVVWAKADSKGQEANESISITALQDTAKVFARMLFDSETGASAANTAKAMPEQNSTAPKTAPGTEAR